MRRIYLALLFYICSSLCIYFVGIQIVNFYVYHVNKISLDFKLIFFQGNINYFIALFALTLAAPLYILIGQFTSKKGKLKRSNNYMQLVDKSRVKKEMLCVHFNNNGEIYLTMGDKMKIATKEVPVALNKFLAFFNVDSFIKFKTLDSWWIGGELMYKRCGLPFITDKGKVWLDGTDSHSLIIGTTNSGKSWSVILPMLISIAMAGESGVTIDVKGELSRYTAQFFINKGYKVYFLDFLDTDNSDCWNPFYLGAKNFIKQKEIEEEETKEVLKKIVKLKKDHEIMGGGITTFNPSMALGKDINGDWILDPDTYRIQTSANYSKAQEYLKDVAMAVTAGDGQNNNKDAFWDSEAGRVLEGLIYLTAETGKLEYVNFDSISKLLNEGDEMVPWLAKSKITFLKAYLDEYKQITDLSKEKLTSYVSSAENTKKSTRNVLDQHLSKILVNQAVKNMLAKNTIDLESLDNQKTMIFVKIHDEKQTYYPLVTLFIQQLWITLAEIARNNGQKTGKERLRIPFNIMFDEMAQFPQFREVINVLTAGRSRGVRLIMSLQGFDQLEATYGDKKARTIRNNVMNKVYLLSGDPTTLEEISKACGTKGVLEKGKPVDKRNLTPDNLAQFKLGEAVIIRQRLGAYKTKLLPFNAYKYFDKIEEYTPKIKTKQQSKWFSVKKEYIRLRKEQEHG